MARKRTFTRGRNPSSVILGSEPSFDGITNEDDLIWEINKSINWYRNNFNQYQYKNALKEYLKNNNMSLDATYAPKKSYEWEYAGIYAHISNRGITLPQSIQDALDKSINALASYGAQKEDAPTVNVQENIKNKIAELIADLECNVDNYLMNIAKKENNEVIDIAEWIKKNNIRSIHANRMAEFFHERQLELELALSGKDEQLNEGYSWLSKPNLRKFTEYTTKIVNLLREQSEIAKSQRKPRAKKKKSPEQLAAKVSYMKQHEQLKLTSLHPKEIVGASKAILYNPTKRILYVYESSSLGDGLSIKGSKIINFDTEKSSRKRVRNEKIMMNGGKFTQGLRASGNAYKEIKSKEYPVNGRISDDIIIVQVLSR